MIRQGLRRIPPWLWFGATIPLSWALFLSLIAPSFAWDIPLSDRPIAVFIGAMLTASAAFFAFVLIQRHRVAGESTGNQANPLLFIVVVGLIARILLFPGPAILEDDFYRYQWDGQVTAAGLDPYQRPPAEFVTHPVVDDLLTQFGAQATPVPDGYEDISEEGWATLLRVNYPHIATIYSPLTQIAFAASQMLTPWQLTGWKLIILLCEIACLLGLIAALRALQQPYVLTTIYWWNPLVMKELGNSLHMDVLLLPVLAAIVWLCATRRQKLMAMATGIAAAIKIWPVLILPALWRRSRASFLWGMAAGALALVLLAPQILAMTDNAGLARYASDWQRNSLAFPILVQLVAPFSNDPGNLARIGVAAILAAVALRFWYRQSTDVENLIGAAGTLVLLLCLLSPTGYPWYALWILPFAVVLPRTVWLLLVACAPFYYLRFWLQAKGLAEGWDWITGLLSAGPVWLWLLNDWRVSSQRRILRNG